MSWKEAEALLTHDTVVVIPLGAAAKEHGLHLRLQNDYLIAEYLKHEVIQRNDVVILPTVNYSYYPAFVDYPGSVSLSVETSARMITEICQSIANFGPRRFYVINTGISTNTPLALSADELRNSGLTLHYTDLHAALDEVEREISEQEGGSHADEIETSIMLYIAPETVRMQLARSNFDAKATGPLKRTPAPGFSVSDSGVWGNATFATREKGEKVVKCLVEHICHDIEILRMTPLTSDSQ